MKLTTYFGERDRAGDAYLADAFTETYARHKLQTSLLMRGIEGFGARQRTHTDRLLSLSEDLPLVSVAVDTRARIESVWEELGELRFDGLVTLETAQLLTAQLEAVRLAPGLDEATKLTVYVGRHEHAGAKPAYEAVVELLHARGVAGATVLLGVDGTAHGVRKRARFFAANAGVPLMVIAVGDGEMIAQALPELGRMLARPLVTLERVRLCKRDGQRLAEPRHVPRTEAAGPRVLQKLMVYTGEQARHQGHPLHHQLIRELRRAGAAGATSLRGMWGYHGDHAPHGDSFWQLRRRVPIVTVVIDRPERIHQLFGVVDRLTDQSGLVTSELLPAV